MPLIFKVKVVPSSGRNKWTIDSAGSIKCYLKNPPEKGKANKELISLVAKALGVARREVEIVSGATARNKHLKIPLDITLEKLLTLLGLERQKSLFE